MTVKYRCLSREHWLHSTAFSLRFFAPLIAASRHLAPAFVNVACRTSCTTRCIGFVMPGSGRLLPWELADGVELTPQMALRVQGDVLGTIALARAGAGLAQTYQFAVARELARGELVEVLAHERGASRSFSLLYPRGVVQTPAVKKLVAFLVAEARRADVR